MLDFYTVSFFGHRRIESVSAVERKLEEIVNGLLREKGYVEFLVGRDGEFDQLVSSTVKQCKRRVGSHSSALVWGTFTEESGTIEGALARDNRDRTIYRIWDLEENPNAKEAITHWRVLERFPYVTLVECRLETGRTHQIRVHMKSIGHPLFADEKYGGMEVLKGLPTQKYKHYIHNCFALCPRQVLHAKTLGFTHPRTGERMHFDSPWAEDMLNLINKWRNYEPNTLGGR